MTAEQGHYDAPTGADLIAAERRRQVEQEGWTPEHDAWHIDDDLAMAAVCYALPVDARPFVNRGTARVPRGWPWHSSWWKPTPEDRVRELVKAGALIAAEIDRLQTTPMPDVSLTDYARVAVETLAADTGEAQQTLERVRALRVVYTRDGAEVVPYKNLLRALDGARR